MAVNDEEQKSSNKLKQNQIFVDTYSIKNKQIEQNNIYEFMGEIE